MIGDVDSERATDTVVLSVSSPVLLAGLESVMVPSARMTVAASQARPVVGN